MVEFTLSSVERTYFHIKHPYIMNIELRRIRHKPQTFDGQIWIDGQRICDCAENANHCIPEGTYQVIVHKCAFHSRKMPLIILSTDYQPPCSDCSHSGCVGINSTPHKGGDGGGLLFCPMIKPGNGVFNRTDGSIIVGRCLAPGCLTHPKDAFNALYERIRKNAERGSEITLSIQNHY